MKQEIECKVSGRVQMVMYRDFVERNAKKLNLTGFVENLSDGSVRIIAQGDHKSLEKLIERLHKGPVMAHVARVDVLWPELKEDFNEFKISY